MYITYICGQLSQDRIMYHNTMYQGKHWHRFSADITVLDNAHWHQLEFENSS